ncbi:polysaccharide deacetylase family protein [Neobacillus cucumis]|uniref:polysaccharide deacetylase family protein n=1 Tax=Neobacillus cucumis TaxID=1740721 RepID=UPI002E1AE076|nr:polysaccharide deacetylase family protein [Neobacillus cucumis]MED4228701.1 polysaccharide deacetylase family protein [Neobacillus cucumis]
MGNLKRGWSIWKLIILVAVGFLLTGVLLNHNFQANAVNKPINQAKNEHINRAFAKEPPHGTVIRNTKDLKLEKELFHKKQEQAIAWRKQHERIKTNVTQPTAASEPDATGPIAYTTEPDATGPIAYTTEPDAAGPTANTTEPVAAEPTANTTEPDATQPAAGATTSSQQQEKDAKPASSGEPNVPPVKSDTQKTIYLTFDDGPSAYSAQIIALLEKFHYKATFFMIDGNIRRYPNAAKLMVRSGETVGLHSVSHNPKIFYASAASIIGELTQNRQTLKEITGVDSYIMRTPYGSVPYMTPEYRKAVQDNGYLMWDWNIDSRDWDYKDSRYVTSVIEQINQMVYHSGPIVVLMHERKETLANLPKLLDYLSKNGWSSKAIDRSMTPVQFRT